jgi:hypothetical protein
MKKLSRFLVGAGVVAGAVLPAGPALADDNPCKGTAPGPHCRPPCFYYVDVDPGDPANGQAPTVTIGETFC